MREGAANIGNIWRLAPCGWSKFRSELGRMHCLCLSASMIIDLSQVWDVCIYKQTLSGSSNASPGSTTLHYICNMDPISIQPLGGRHMS